MRTTPAIVRRLTLLAAAPWAAAMPVQAQNQGAACPNPVELTQGLTEPLATVRFLADDALGGRLAGSAGERCAGEFIADRLRALGLRGAGADGSFFQDVPLASTLNPHASAGTGRNVLALLEGSDASLREEVIVVGAHYDHLGAGGPGSMAPGETAIHNGADDNASGVAAMLAVAERLVQRQRPARSVLFIAFTGEESGLLGSAHFVRQPTFPLARVRAMLNLDMVGRLGSDALIVYGVDTAEEWRTLLASAAAAAGVELALRPEGYGPSDHTSFYTNDIPVLHFFTNTHADYHRPTDDWDRIDAVGLNRVATLVTQLTRSLTEPQARITLLQRAGEPPRPAGGGGYGAYLGTVPDFTPVDNGVLLGGVTAGSPGDRAGLRKGDILIGFGDRVIGDLQSFTDALRAHRPGDEVLLRVQRDGRELTLRAVLGSRDN